MSARIKEMLTDIDYGLTYGSIIRLLKKSDVFPYVERSDKAIFAI